MPLLKLEDTFSPEVLEVTEELGGKAGILEYLCRVNPKLRDYILPGRYIPFSEITVGSVDDILTKMGKSIDDIISRSTHPDDGIAYIGGIDNISKYDLAYVIKIRALESQIAEMKTKLVSSEAKQQVIDSINSDKDKIQKDIQEKYAFVFEAIYDACDDWTDGSLESHCISTMVMYDLEGYVRILDKYQAEKYIDTEFFSSEEEVHMYGDVRKGYGDDTELRDFSSGFHTEGKAKKLSEDIRRFIEGKTKQEIKELIEEIRGANIPQYFSNYASDYGENNMGVFTQDEINAKESDLSKLKQKHIGGNFLNHQERLAKHIAHNNLRGLDQTGLYIQEHLGEDYDYGTLLEHPHIPGRFTFSGREKKNPGGFLRDAWPTFFMNGDQGNVLLEGTVKFPFQKLCSIYDEIKRTGLLIDDVSLQIEFASKGDSVYILQVRAFRKNIYPKWEIDKPLGSFDFESIYGVTPEEGVLIQPNELQVFDENRQNDFDPFELQQTKLAVTSCVAPFDHKMTELAYYPEIAMFGLSVDLDVSKDRDFRFWSNGRSYKVEQT